MNDAASLEDWLARCARRDRAALDALYRATAPQLLACALQILKRRALAEEVLQDVFVQVWQRAAQFDQHRGRPMAWLISMTRYRAIDILRRERSISTDPLDLDDLVTDDSASADQLDGEGLVAHDEQVLRNCLQRLNSSQRQSIELAFLSGRSHQEVAVRMDRPLGSVKSWIRRGLVSLRECIDSCAVRTTT